MINLYRLAQKKKIMLAEELRVYDIKSTYHKRMHSREHYLIYRDCSTAGFFSFLYTFFAEIEFAVSRGMVPVIDMENYNSQFGARIGNIWEIFYDQPAGVSLNELYLLGKFRHSCGCIYDNGLRLPWDMKWTKDPSLLLEKKKLFDMYIRPSVSLNENIHLHSSVFDGWHSTVGVTLRGGCYTSMKPYGHPIQPSPEAILRRCEELIESGECDSIYLSSIDSDIVSLFSNRFGSRLLKMNRNTFSSGATDLFAEIKQSETMLSHYMSYITSIYLFRSCKRLLGGVTSSSIFLPLICQDDVIHEISFLGYYQ